MGWRGRGKRLRSYLHVLLNFVFFTYLFYFQISSVSYNYGNLTLLFIYSYFSVSGVNQKLPVFQFLNLLNSRLLYLQNNISQSAGATEYVDFIFAVRKDPTQCFGYDIKPHLRVRFHFWSFEAIWSTCLLSLTSGPLCPEWYCLVGLGCRTHRLLLCRGVRPPCHQRVS